MNVKETLINNVLNTLNDDDFQDDLVDFIKKALDGDDCEKINDAFYWGSKSGLLEFFTMYRKRS